MSIHSGHTHSYDVGVAKSIGVNAAIVFNHIVYWLRINASKSHNIKEGKVWMYESQRDIADFLEYLTLDEVKKAIVKILESGLLIKGNFNSNAFDKTAWYTTADQDIINIKKTRTKELYGSIERAPGLHPKCPTAPSIYGQEEQQEDNTVCIGAEVTRQGPLLLGAVSSESNIPREVTKINSSGKEITINRNEIIAMSVRSRKEWFLPEIDEAWDILCSYQGDVNDGFGFIEGTIRNLRNFSRAEHANKNKTKKEIKCESKTQKNDNQESNEKSSKNKDSSSEKCSMASPFLPLKEMLAKKYHPGWKNGEDS